MIIEAYNYLQKIIDGSIQPTQTINLPTQVINPPTRVINPPTRVINPPTQVIHPPTQVIEPPPHKNPRMNSPEVKNVEVKSEIDHVIEEIEFDEEDDDFFTENVQVSAGTEDVVQETSPNGETIQEINVHEDLKQSIVSETNDTGQIIASNQQEDTDRIYNCIECSIVLPEPDDPIGSFRHMTRAEKFQNAYANISSKNPVCSSFLICPQCKLKKCNAMPD